MGCGALASMKMPKIPGLKPEDDKLRSFDKDLSKEPVLLGGGKFSGAKGVEKKCRVDDKGHELHFDTTPYIRYDHYKCSLCPMCGSGKRWCCSYCEYDLCPNCGPPPAGQEAKCPQGHKLGWGSNPNVPGNVYSCKKCGFSLATGDRMCCVQCAFDMCYKCATPPKGKSKFK